MKFKKGDLVRIKKDFSTEGGDNCLSDLRYWHRNPVRISFIDAYSNIRITSRVEKSIAWYINKADLIQHSVELENK